LRHRCIESETKGKDDSPVKPRVKGLTAVVQSKVISTRKSSCKTLSLIHSLMTLRLGLPVNRRHLQSRYFFAASGCRRGSDQAVPGDSLFLIAVLTRLMTTGIACILTYLLSLGRIEFMHVSFSRRHFLQLSAAAIASVSEAASKRRGALSKKGCCFAAREKSPWLDYTRALNPEWLYTWNTDLPQGLPKDIEFCPMVWGGGNEDKLKAKLEKLAPLVKDGQLKYLLGFNEPDKKDQSNITVERALQLWPLLMELNVPLVSPSCAHPDREWMLNFMNGVQRLKLRVDYIGAHSYGGPNPKALLNRMEKVARMFGRPIWITEFAVADWQAKSLKQNKHSPQQVAQFMQAVIPAFNASPFIARYAWFSGQPNHKALGNSALFDNHGKLTALGRLYAQA
jgi:hypothetical protein